MMEGVDKLAYRIPEAVEATGLSRATLYRLADAGKLKLTKVCGRTLIRRAELERLLRDEAA